MLLTEWNWDTALKVRGEESFAQGEQIGREEANRETARKMKAAAYPVEQISAMTGLSPEEIEKL